MFKVGDIVKITSHSQFYGHKDVFNPSNMLGKIITLSDIYPNFTIKVLWENGNYNLYTEHDLELGDLSIFEKLGD